MVFVVQVVGSDEHCSPLGGRVSDEGPALVCLLPPSATASSDLDTQPQL